MRDLVVAQSGTAAAATADFVCDGSNDEAEINAAIQLLGAEGGGTISIAAGHYSISTNIAIIGLDNIHLQGAGAGQTVITTAPDFYYTNFQAAIGFQDVQTFSCRGITVDASGASDILNGIQCDVSKDGVIEDCESLIRSGWSYGIWSLRSDNIQILNNHVSGAATYAGTSPLQEGIELFNSSNVVIEGNTIDNIGGAGIYLFSPTDTYEISNIRIAGNTVNYAARAVFIAHEGPRTVENVVITGNTFNNSVLAGIHVYNIDFHNFSGPGPAATVENPQYLRDITISDNEISLAEQSAATAAGILFENSAGPGEAFYSDINVSNNTIFQSSPHGTPINVINVPDVEFVNNLLQSNASSYLIDVMAGGSGNNIYQVSDPGDVVIEQANGGFDTVLADIDYALGANVEALFLSGDAVSATGNDADNLLSTVDTGTTNNVLIGKGGNDIMIGGKGNDVYEVTDPGDVVIEQADEGFDTVWVGFDYVLGANVEALYLAQSGSVRGTGNAGPNIIDATYSRAPDNIIDGAGGSDVLTGGLGGDTFIFKADEADGDTVTDFSAAEGDRLVFIGFGPDATFSRIGSSNQWQLTYANGSAHETITLSNGAAPDGYFLDQQQPASTTYTSFAVSGFAGITANWATGLSNDGFGVLLSEDSERYIFAAANGVTWINGTGLTVSDGVLHWNTLTSVEHRSADGSILYESITNFDAAFLGGGKQLALDGHELASLLSGADAINGSSGRDAMIGFEGDDIFNASGGADQLDGGGGTDTFMATSASQFVSGLRLINMEKIQFNFSGSVDLDPVDADTGTYVFRSFNPLTVTLNTNASLTDWTAAKTWVGGAGQDNLVINHAYDVATGAYSFSNWTAGVDTVTLNGADHAPGDPALVITGTSVNDTINAFGGSDDLFGNAGDDVLNAGDDDDFLAGGTGNDILNGGAGVDSANYQFVTSDSNGAAVTENIVFTLGNDGNGTAAGGSQVGTDTLNSIEILRGGSGDDTFIITCSGDNTFIGNEGVDTIDYSGNSGAVTLVLNSTGGSATGADVGNDQLSTIENVITGSGDDTYNIDELSTRVLDAGAGNDAISFAGIHSSEATAYTIDLAAGTATGAGPGSGTITLANFENATGGTAGDLLTGNDLANTLSGLDGDDRLNGLAGADRLLGGTGADRFVFDAVALTDAHAAIIDRITDYNQGNGAYEPAEGDQIDLSALLAAAYNHGNGEPVSALVRVTEDASNDFAYLQIDPDGTANGANFITVARLDGLHSGDNVSIILDSSASEGASITVGETPVPGSVSISDVSVSEGDNGTRVATFTVTRSGGTAAFAVNFATSDGSATIAGNDYVANSGTLNFADGVDTQTISVTINGDTRVEPDEAFSVNLSGATNGATISDTSGTGTISNDDVAGSISIDDVTITEGNSGIRIETFTVTRSGGTAAFAVDFATSDGSATVADHDYVANSGTLNFADGVNTQTISVTINSDTRVEADEALSVNLSGATNGATISDTSGTGTISNDDVAGSISINDVTITEGNNGTRIETFTVTRSGGTAAFALDFATSDGSATVADHDYLANSGTLSFGDGVNTQTISVIINGDTRVEANEAFSVNLSGATNGAAISDDSGTGTISNDDVAGSISINDVTITEGNNGTRIETFTVTRSGGTAAFAVDFATSDGSATVADHDYVANSGTLSFGDGVNTRTISVTINGDTKVESGEAFFVKLSGATNGAVISGSQGTGTISNDDTGHAPVSDFNGDGFSDVLWRNNSSGDTGFSDLHGGNAWHSLGGSSTAYKVAGTGDFNGDGFSDVLWRNNSSGDTGYTDVHGGNAWHGLGGSSTAYSIVGVGDFNGDGFSDILFRNAASGDIGYSDQHNANAWHGLGAASTAYSVAGTGDFNGDGFSDVLWRNNSSGDTGYSDIHGGNAWHGLGASSTASNVVGIGDFNGDGFSDVLWRNNSSGDTSYTDVHDVNASRGLGASSTAYSIVGVGDYSGDGFDDILYRNAISGDTGYSDLHANAWHGLGAASTAYLIVA